MKVNSFCKEAQNRIASFSKRPILFFCKKFAHDKLSVEDRKAFRHLLVEKIKAQNFYKKKGFPLDPLLKIGSRPEQTFLALSISHCKNLACFVLSFKEDSSSKKLSLGLDLEETNRASHQIVARISSLKERNSSPSPSLLWTAKEAGFKCLAQKTLALSDCSISHWEKSSLKGAYLFKAESRGGKAQGLAYLTGSMTLAYAESSAGLSQN